MMRMLAIVALTVAVWQPARAESRFSLDSIAAWGKFPRFCVNTYRWGDKFFNTVDTVYVRGSGKRFNVKAKVNSWADTYNFRFDNGYRMEMMSRPSTTLGFYLTYMAVSVGYDMNIGRYFGGAPEARQRFNFQFSCQLFAVDMQYVTNDMGTRIKRLGEPGSMKDVNIIFPDVTTSQWGVNLYYFFNHKRYSQSAAFSYGKIQQRSAGTPFLGLSFSGQNYKFDFWDLAQQLGSELPASWGYYYHVQNRNYCVRAGYAYNWVFHHGWCLGISAGLNLGLREGLVNVTDSNRYSFSSSAVGRMSLIYNYKTKWFFGVVGGTDAQLFYDKQHTMISNNFTVEASAGFRFDFR